MAIRYGRSRFNDHIVGTPEDDELYGYERDDIAGDIMSDTLEGGDGNDHLFGGGGADTLRGGAHNDTLEGGTRGDVLDGGTGFDTALYWHSGSAIFVNLLEGRGYLGEADGDTLISIEKVIGSEHGDLIVGDHDGNELHGWLGDDGIWGGHGEDWLYGDLGTDRLYGGRGTDHLDGGFSTDHLYGEDGIDVLDGGEGDDFLYGGPDHDILRGSRGADLNSGGEDPGGLDRDWIDYSSYRSSGAVIVNLETGRGTGGFAEGDRYDGIEVVIGSRWDDTITGDGQSNYLGGEEGVDLLMGGGGDDSLAGGIGADQLDGGFGSDTLSYHYSSAGVWVDLGAGTARFGHAEGDKFARMENIEGSEHYDVLVGDANDNILTGWGIRGDELRGNAGNDRLLGGIGDDRIWGGAGADYIAGGGGRDIFIYTSVSDSAPSSFGAPMTYDEIRWSAGARIDLSSIDANTTTPGNDAFTMSPFPDTFTGTGQIRIERHDPRSVNVLGETTGDGVADFMIRVSSPVLLDATDLLFWM